MKFRSWLLSKPSHLPADAIGYGSVQTAASRRITRDGHCESEHKRQRVPVDRRLICWNLHVAGCLRTPGARRQTPQHTVVSHSGDCLHTRAPPIAGSRMWRRRCAARTWTAGTASPRSSPPSGARSASDVTVFACCTCLKHMRVGRCQCARGCVNPGSAAGGMARHGALCAHEKLGMLSARSATGSGACPECAARPAWSLTRTPLRSRARSMRGSHFPGWARPREFNAQLLESVGRREEARDNVRATQHSC